MMRSGYCKRLRKPKMLCSCLEASSEHEMRERINRSRPRPLHDSLPSSMVPSKVDPFMEHRPDLRASKIRTKTGKCRKAPVQRVDYRSPEMKIYEPEVVDEEFCGYMKLAESFLGHLRRPKDVAIARRLLDKCESLHDTDQLSVKVHVNTFLKYLIRVLHWSSGHYQCPAYPTQCANQQKPQDWSSAWLQPNRVYMALKHLPNNTSVLYMAIANDVDAGWESNGFSRHVNSHKSKNKKNRSGKWTEYLRRYMKSMECTSECPYVRPLCS